MERGLLFSEDAFGIPRGTVKATVLIETLPAAFEMEEILFELREHGAGLNAGRWDYIFSAIECFPDRPEMVLPDRGDVKMTVPLCVPIPSCWWRPATGAGHTPSAGWLR